MRQILYLALGVTLWACGARAFISSRLTAQLVGLRSDDSRPEKMGGAAHKCYRKCVAGDTRTCNYKFTLNEYSTMAIACGECPFRVEDCYERGCITAGGDPREIRVVNHMLPGPSVQVCRGDTIRVSLINNFGSDTATIHWHGMYQKDSPFMDGVPYVTQCPISPKNSFVYNFTADPIGTHIWHSHSGLQEPDGFFGSVVVRGANDKLEKYYDHDLAEHVIIIWHWFRHPTNSIVKSTFFRSITALGHNLIINGLTASANFTNTSTGVTYRTPRAVFNVTQGFRYRFRSLANVAINCPVQVSVDNHTLLVIASDGASIKPVEVDSYIITAGERYDFVLTANQSFGNYWIKFRGLGNCAANSTFALAILRYENATIPDPTGSPTYDDTDRTGVLLNPIGPIVELINHTLIPVADLETTSDDVVDVSGKPDYTFYWSLGLHFYNQFRTPGPYAQINEVSFDFPPVPLLTQHHNVTQDMYCLNNDLTNADCCYDYRICPTIYSVDLGSLVEMVFYDNTTLANVTHPIHMHGGHFRVVYMEYGNGSLTLDEVKARNANGSIEKAFDTAPLKDVVGVPSRGFAVLRIRADNPGYWFIHCHVGVHAEEGMALVLKVGDDSEMVRAPHDFPKCGNHDITSTPRPQSAANGTSDHCRCKDTSKRIPERT